MRNWTGAPRSPQRTWSENVIFRLLQLDGSATTNRSSSTDSFKSDFGGFAPIVSSPGTFRRTWGTRPVSTGSGTANPPPPPEFHAHCLPSRASMKPVIERTVTEPVAGVVKSHVVPPCAAAGHPPPPHPALRRTASGSYRHHPRLCLWHLWTARWSTSPCPPCSEPFTLPLRPFNGWSRAMRSSGPLAVFGGAMGDRYGRRRTFLWGVALFAFASAACASLSFPRPLIAARVRSRESAPLC